jgi:outer membrane protein TolC
VGFDFELPIGNRAARARQQRRQWEVNRSLQQFRAVVESGITEVEIAAREVQTAQQEISGQYRAMVAAASETDYLVDRWQTLPEADDSVTLLLENLLDSQERQADAEAAFARAQFDFAVAMVRLKQAMGTLFQVHDE